MFCKICSITCKCLRCFQKWHICLTHRSNLFFFKPAFISSNDNCNKNNYNGGAEEAHYPTLWKPLPESNSVLANCFCLTPYFLFLVMSAWLWLFQDVGLALRTLLATVDETLPQLPASTHREVRLVSPASPVLVPRDAKLKIGRGKVWIAVFCFIFSSDRSRWRRSCWTRTWRSWSPRWSWPNSMWWPGM